MSEPNVPSDPLTVWATALASATAGLLAIRATLKKLGLLSGDPNYEKMAKAFFAEKSVDDERHRDVLSADIRSLSAAIRELIDMTRQQHEATRKELRDANDATRAAVTGLLTAYQGLLTGVAAKVDVLFMRNGGQAK